MEKAQSESRRRVPSTARELSGEGGIRTRGGCDTTRHFQCRTFGLSVTSPSDSKFLLRCDLRHLILCVYLLLPP